MVSERLCGSGTSLFLGAFEWQRESMLVPATCALGQVIQVIEKQATRNYGDYFKSQAIKYGPVSCLRVFWPLPHLGHL